MKYIIGYSNFVPQKCEKNSENCFCMGFRTLRIFSDDFFRQVLEGGLSHSLGQGQYLWIEIYIQIYSQIYHTKKLGVLKIIYNFYFLSYSRLCSQFSSVFLHKHKILLTKKKFFRSGQIFMKDVQWAETNEKSIFRFLCFELWSILYPKIHQKIDQLWVQKRPYLKN